MKMGKRWRTLRELSLSILCIYRLTPFDEDDDVEVKLSKSKDMNVVLSNCNPVSYCSSLKQGGVNSLKASYLDPHSSKSF